MIDFKTFTTESWVSLLINGFALILFFIMLFTLPGIPEIENEKRAKVRFKLALVFGILTCFADIIGTVLWNTDKHTTLFKISAWTEGVLVVLFLYFKTMYVFNYLDNKIKINRIFIMIIQFVIHAILFATIMIPFNQNFLFIPSNVNLITYGPWYSIFMYMVVVFMVLMVFFFVINIKRVGWRDSILLILMQVVPPFCYYFVLQEAPILLSLQAIFLLTSYILIYQGRIWNLSENEKLVVVQKNQLSDMRLRLVQSQVKPHFLYNTLSNIAYYCKKDPNIAHKLTLDFSNYLRANIDSLDSSNLIEFSKELEHTKTYLEIEKIRFEDRVNVEYNIEYDDFKVPSLILQPIVENAVKHGVCKKEEGGTIKIYTKKDADQIIITVEDNGVGFDTSVDISDGRSHVGISSAKNRLEQMCSGHMSIESTINKGTVVRMYIPVETN